MRSPLRVDSCSGDWLLLLPFPQVAPCICTSRAVFRAAGCLPLATGGIALHCVVVDGDAWRLAAEKPAHTHTHTKVLRLVALRCAVW
ncbi:hypothetical protein ACLKA6_002629 [Drosophila palustris]